MRNTKDKKFYRKSKRFVEFYWCNLLNNVYNYDQTSMMELFCENNYSLLVVNLAVNYFRNITPL